MKLLRQNNDLDKDTGDYRAYTGRGKVWSIHDCTLGGENYEACTRRVTRELTLGGGTMELTLGGENYEVCIRRGNFEGGENYEAYIRREN